MKKNGVATCKRQFCDRLPEYIVLGWGPNFCLSLELIQTGNQRAARLFIEFFRFGFGLGFSICLFFFNILLYQFRVISVSKIITILKTTLINVVLILFCQLAV